MFLKTSNKLAISYKERKYTYEDVLSVVKHYASLYNSETTNKVAIFSENRPEWIFSYYSAWYNQATNVPIDCMSVADEVAYTLDDCRPEVIFVSQEKLEVLNDAISKISYTPKIIIIDEVGDKQINNDEKFPTPDLQDTAVIIYTSGTTGSPKGVMISYENIQTNLDAVVDDVNIFHEGIRVLVLLPLHHIFPLLGSMVATIAVDGCMCMSPSMESKDILETMSNNKVQLMIGVPRLYTVIRNGIKSKIDKSKIGKFLFAVAEKLNSEAFSKKIFKAVHDKLGGHMMYMVCGGAAIDPLVARDYKTLGFEMLEGFGMTEASPMITFTRPGDRVIGSTGTRMKTTEVEIRDGEIVARGKNIMKGYYNRPEETAEVLKDGWLYTGDIGHFDDKGHLFITGRKKEIIVLPNGKNINPTELEFKLQNLSSYIDEVATFVADDILQVIICPNFAEMRRDNLLDAKSYFQNIVEEQFNTNVAPYKKIMKIHISHEELPKTRLDKIKRFMLADIVKKDSSEEGKNMEEPKFEEYKILKSFLEETKNKLVFPNYHLEFDLAMDSLDRVSLQTFIHSTFGIDIQAEHFISYKSVLKLAENIKERKQKISKDIVNWTDIVKEKIHVSLPKSWSLTRLMIRLSRYFFKSYFRFRSSGISNIPNTPCIIAPNHQSFIDGFLVASLFKREIFRNTVFYAKAKHVSKSWKQYIAERNNIIVVDVNQDLKLSIQKLAEALRNKRNVMIFPEGTRTKDGSLGDFKKTFAILSKELNVPIVPVAITGAYQSCSKPMLPRLFGTIKVDFLEAVYPQKESYDDISKNVYEKINSVVKKS